MYIIILQKDSNLNGEDGVLSMDSKTMPTAARKIDPKSQKYAENWLPIKAIQNGETDLIITIDPNSGLYEESKEVKEIFKKYHETYTLSTPTKRGCNFIGWELSDDAVFDE